MFCKNCGKELPEESTFCPGCGCAVNAAPQSESQQQKPADAKSFGWALLGFFFPLIGLILYLVWKDQTPLKASSCGKGALIGVIFSVVTGILSGVLSSCLLMMNM